MTQNTPLTHKDEDKIKELILKRGELVDSIKSVQFEIDAIETVLKTVEYPSKMTFISGKFKMDVSMVRSKSIDERKLTEKIKGLGLDPEKFKTLQWDFANATLKTIADDDDVKNVGAVSQRVAFK